MVKLKLTKSDDGIITNVSLRNGDTDFDDETADKLIVGVTKIVDGKVFYLTDVEYNDEGYINVISTASDGNQLLDESEIGSFVPDATKLVNGHLVVDAEKARQIAEEASIPETTQQDLINAQLMKTAAQLQLTNAALMKQVAELEVKDG